MSRAIEFLIKIGNPRSIALIKANTGIVPLHREQIISALAFAEKESELGYNLLLAKYCDDRTAHQFISDYIKIWGIEKNASEQGLNALHYIVDIITDKPLPSQLKRMNALRNRYLRSRFSHVNIIKKTNDIVQEKGLKENCIEARQLRSYALNQLRKSNMCPRCRGTGEIGRTQKRTCPECNGKGRLIGDISLVIKSLNCTEAYFNRYIRQLVIEFEQHCYHEISNAESAIKMRLKKERAESN